jgi:undecaprenyl phosphate N,N'-diacetylbacillosamine 1-phosphate transferase
MKKIKIKEAPRGNILQLYKKIFSLYISGLTAFFSIVLTNISIVIIMLLSSPKTQRLNINILILVLSISTILILFFSFISTKTINTSISYKLKQIIKRFIDIIISSTCILYLMPLFIIVTILIKVSSPGPIFNRTKRIGQFGKEYIHYKFRTSCLINNKIAVTRIGLVLQRTDLDLLPNIYNVLEGDLSLVGPFPRFPENISLSVDREKKILTVRPGLTGLWQISKRSTHGKSAIKKAINLDLKYINEWSLILDIKILLKTFILVIFGTNKFTDRFLG